MLTMVCAKALSRGKRVWSCVRSVYKVAWEAMMQERTYLSFFFNRWLQRISRILAVLGYEGIKQATPVVLRPKRKSSAHSL